MLLHVSRFILSILCFLNHSLALFLSHSFTLSLFFSLPFSFSVPGLSFTIAIERLEGRHYSIIRCTLIFIFSQTMAATKRNAGLTSAVPRATLNDEELVRTCPLVTIYFIVAMSRHQLINQVRYACPVRGLAATALSHWYLSTLYRWNNDFLSAVFLPLCGVIMRCN